MSKSVIVTGSSRGIGQAVAERLGRDGYIVVLHCRQNRSQAEAVSERLKNEGCDGTRTSV